MESIQQLPKLNLTWHGYQRAKQRGIIPKWVHKPLADSFIVGKINQTKNKQIIDCGNLMKIVLPDMEAYIRNRRMIVTLVKRKRKYVV